MKKFFFISVLLVVSFTMIFNLTSCKLTDELDINPRSLTISKADTTFTIDVQTGGGKWTVNSDQTWCTVTPTSAKGDKSVTVKVEANTTGVQRQCEILFSYTGSANFVLTQQK